MGDIEMDDRLRARHEVDVVGRVARGRRRGGASPRPASAGRTSSRSRRPAPSRELEPADVGPAAVLLRPDVRDGEVRHRRASSARAARRASGPGTTRAARARARSRPRSPATVSRTIPTRGDVVELIGDRRSARRRRGRLAAPADRRSWRIAWPPPVAQLGADDRRRRRRGRSRRGAARVGPGPRCAQRPAIPPIRSLSVGARQRLELGRARREADGRAGPRRRARPGDVAAGRRAPRRAPAAAQHDLAPAHLVPGRRPGLVRGGRERGWSGRLAARRPAASSSPGPRRWRAAARPERRQRQLARRRPRSPSAVTSQRRRQPAEIADVLAVLELDEPVASRVRAARSGPAPRAGGAPTGRASACGPARRAVACTKLPSFGSSPKSPPYAQCVRPSGRSWTRPWSQPLPDEPALEPGRRLDRVPVLGERAVAVAHRVRVLAHDQRPALRARTWRGRRSRRSSGTSGRRGR